MAPTLRSAGSSLPQRARWASIRPALMGERGALPSVTQHRYITRPPSSCSPSRNRRSESHPAPWSPATRVWLPARSASVGRRPCRLCRVLPQASSHRPLHLQCALWLERRRRKGPALPSDPNTGREQSPFTTGLLGRACSTARPWPRAGVVVSGPASASSWGRL